MIIALLFKVCSDFRTGLKIIFDQIGIYNPAFDNDVIIHLEKIKYVNQSTIMEPIGMLPTMAALLADAGSKYYYYDGSLEEPPCPQSILWIIFGTPLPVSAGQMKRSVKFLNVARL